MSNRELLQKVEEKKKNWSAIRIGEIGFAAYPVIPLPTNTISLQALSGIREYTAYLPTHSLPAGTTCVCSIAWNFEMLSYGASMGRKNKIYREYAYINKLSIN